MPDATSKAIPNPQRKALFEELSAWRWVALYIVVSLILAVSVQSHFPLEEKQLHGASVLDESGSSSDGTDVDDAWIQSGLIRLVDSEQGLHVEASAADVQFASRPVTVLESASFVRLKACLGASVKPDSLFIAFASIADQRLDFNRAYRLRSDDGGEVGGCFEGLMPRRSGDAPQAILQIQAHKGPDAFLLTELSTQALRENPRWLWLRNGMLILGIALIAARFAPYRATDPGPAGIFGLMVVAAIIFGCCVSVELKADIYEFVTGGRSSAIETSLQELLRIAFPIGGFSLFTLMHAVLFASATVFLASASGTAWLSLLLLGAATETLQIFVPGRGPGLSDMLVDWSGVALGLVLLFLLRRGEGKGLLLKE